MAAETGALVTREYRGFRGVDLRGDEVHLSRSPDAMNVWKNRRGLDSISTRPALEKKYSFDAPVYGIFFFTAGDIDMTIVHSGEKLYKIEGEERSVLYSGVRASKSDSFIYAGVWYFKDGESYLKYDGAEISEVVGYIPTTSIGRKPLGGGSMHEDVNLLSPLRINTFLSDGESTEYYLDATELDEDFVPIVTVDGESVTDFTFDAAAGKITFSKAPPEPLTDGQDNVSVKFSCTVEGYADKIKKCTLLSIFDNRVFFSGNPDLPSTVWHCSLNEPSYCSDLDYYSEGLDAAAVRGLVAGNNSLWVLREPSQANTTVFYHTPTPDAQYGKVYPSVHSSISTGCVGAAINFMDDIVFFSERGMEGVSGDIMSEQVLSHRSSLVDREMISERGYRDMLLCEWEGYLFVIIGEKIYLADSMAKFQNENHIEYEWFTWRIDKRALCCRVWGGMLYLGCEDGIYAFSGTEGDVESWWTTPKDNFGTGQKTKTTHKRGCVCEAKGDIALSVKTEKSEFEDIGEYPGITDHFVARIKRKKWKDIQLKFYSKTGFSLERVTLESFIGGYLKR